jgi:hypothetical protein
MLHMYLVPSRLRQDMKLLQFGSVHDDGADLIVNLSPWPR